MSAAIGNGRGSEVVAQISTYPLDVRHAQFLLAHQIRVWSPMVDRIVVTIDTHQSRSGRYRGNNFEENLGRLRHLLNSLQGSCPKLQVSDVDYSHAMRQKVSQYFFGTDTIPNKAWDGGPFYSYFYGLFVADARYVMHFDGDMMFGGGSKTWIDDAIACMADRPDVLVAAPFSGPPRPDGQIFGHKAERKFHASGDSLPYLARRHADMSTRVFLMDLDRFKTALGRLQSYHPNLVQIIKAKLLGNTPDTREAEVVMSRAMKARSFHRIDLMGQAPGLWSLHPPFRSEEFYARLPEIIRDVEADNVPFAQRGHYDLNDSIISWTKARAANRWYRRHWNMLRQRLTDLPEKQIQRPFPKF